MTIRQGRECQLRFGIKRGKLGRYRQMFAHVQGTSVMSERTRTTSQPDTSQSGVLPRPVLEPEVRQESPPPSPATRQDSAGALNSGTPVITEGRDGSAQRDQDSAKGH